MSVDLWQAHVELLRLFLAHRQNIADSIEAVLNAQRTPNRYLQSQSVLSRQFEDCFFRHPALDPSQTPLRGQLEEAYWTSGFKPRQVQHLHNDLIHPAEMMMRGVHCWQQTRWPGRGDRIHYAHTLFNLYVLRCLEFLSLRIFDHDAAAGRLAETQALLDELWKTSPVHQPVFVRDARWLIPLAQSLITDALAPYLQVAARVTDTLPDADVLEIHKAHVRMLGGHLTSQIRHYSTRDRLAIDDRSVVLRTRTSNALDLALLIQGLVGLLKAYDRASQSGDERTRLEMAGAIFQGISPDPELFLNRLDLLSAYSMIEHVFIASNADGLAVYSTLGQRHVHLLEEYRALMHRSIPALRNDIPRFRPVDGGYSPYGILFGLPTNLIEHMALKAVQRDAETRFSLEDVFRDDVSDDDTRRAKLAWVNGWRSLPHVSRDMQRLFDYPQQFAEEIYSRIERELRQPDTNDSAKTGRLHIASADTPAPSEIPELPVRYFVSSDKHIVAAHKAESSDQAKLLASRQEGHFLVTYETPGGWMALKKELLADILGAGHNARIVGLPPEAAQVLRLMIIGLAE